MICYSFDPPLRYHTLYYDTVTKPTQPMTQLKAKSQDDQRRKVFSIV